MKNFFLKVSRSRVVRANILMVGGNFGANIGAYLYHLFMARLLLPSNYGALQSLISVSNIFNVPLTTLNTVVVKFIASFVGSGEEGKVSSLYHTLRRLFFYVFIIGSFVFLIFWGPLLAFLHLQSWMLFLFLDISLFFGLLSILNRAALQGLAQFFHLTVVQSIEAYGKLILGVVAVGIGWELTGAFGAFVFASILGFMYTSWVLGKLLRPNTASVDLPVKRMVTYSVPTFFATISLISFYNTDIVLVRHFFSAYEAGLYSALSVLGKIIFFASAPIANTMFPLVSEAHARGGGYQRIFLLSLALTACLAGAIALVYTIFPGASLKILVGIQYLPALPYLASFSIFLAFCTLNNLLVSFFLSIHESAPICLSFIAALVQATLIWFYHDSLIGVIGISMWVSASLFGLLLVYYAYAERSQIAFRYRAGSQSRKVH